MRLILDKSRMRLILGIGRVLGRFPSGVRVPGVAAAWLAVVCVTIFVPGGAAPGRDDGAVERRPTEVCRASAAAWILDGKPEAPGGAIEVDVTPDGGRWTLSGPAGFTALTTTGDRVGASAIRDVPRGRYVLTCDADLPDLVPPAPMAQDLLSGGTLSFTALYSQRVEVETVFVPAGTFTMGRRDDGDDGAIGDDNELPRHEVTLSAYRIGKYETTNGQVAGVLTWALRQGYLEGKDGQPYV